jgi:hypothetical protein
MTAAFCGLQSTSVHIPDEVLADLQHRLRSTRWPMDAGNEDEFYGVNRHYLEGLVRYWIEEFDWRKAEQTSNRYEHYHVQVDGVPLPHNLDMNFWKIADLWHTLMTDVLGGPKYAARAAMWGLW